MSKRRAKTTGLEEHKRIQVQVARKQIEGDVAAIFDSRTQSLMNEDDVLGMVMAAALAARDQRRDVHVIRECRALDHPGSRHYGRFRSRVNEEAWRAGPDEEDEVETAAA